MQRTLYHYLLLLTCTVLLASCESATNVSNPNITITRSNRTLFIVNEGNFQKSNSSLDAVLLRDSLQQADTILDHSVLHTLGQGNDILIVGKHALILDNGSNTLDILDADSLRLLATIPFGLDAPNKMALIAPDTLLVTRRNTTSAALVDLKSNRIVDSIPLGAASIAVTVLNKKAYVTTGATAYGGPWTLDIIDLSTRHVVKKVPLGGTPEQALADSLQLEVIIGMAADYATFSPQFYFLDAGNDVVTDSLTVGTPMDDAQITTGLPYFLITGSNVYPLARATHTLGASLIHGGTPFYKGFLDPTGRDLYLGVYDFTSGSGKVDVYHTPTGLLTWSIPTGIAPGHFAFYH